MMVRRLSRRNTDVGNLGLILTILIMKKREILEFLESVDMESEVYLVNSEVFYDGWWLNNIVGAVTVCGNEGAESVDNLPVLVYTDRTMVRDKFLCREGDGLLSEIYDDNDLAVDEVEYYGSGENR